MEDLASMVFAAVLGGRWADRDGPGGPLIAGVISLAVGLVVSGLSASLPPMLIGRALQGLGDGSLTVAIFMLVYPMSLRPAVFAWTSSAWVLASLLGPPAPAFVTKTWGWQWVLPSLVPRGTLWAAPGVPTAVLSRGFLAGAFFAGNAFLPPVLGLGMSSVSLLVMGHSAQGEVGFNTAAAQILDGLSTELLIGLGGALTATATLALGIPWLYIGLIAVALAAVLVAPRTALPSYAVEDSPR